MKNLFATSSVLLWGVSVICGFAGGCSSANLDGNGSGDSGDNTLGMRYVVDVAAFTPDSEAVTRITAGEKSGDDYPVLWEGDETLLIAEFADGELNEQTESFDFSTDDGSEASFRFELFDDPLADSYIYWALHPANGLNEFGNNLDGELCAAFTLPQLQRPQTQRFPDSDAILMFSGSAEMDSRAERLDFRFSNVAAFGHFMLLNLALEEGERVGTMTFACDDRKLSGKFEYLPQADERYAEVDCRYSVTVDVSSYAEAGAGGESILDVWFTVLPAEDIRRFSVSVTTDRGRVFKKNVVLEEGREALSFTAGRSSLLGVDMGGIKAEGEGDNDPSERTLSGVLDGAGSVSCGDSLPEVAVVTYEGDGNRIDSGKLGILTFNGFDKITAVSLLMHAEGGAAKAVINLTVYGSIPLALPSVTVAEGDSAVYYALEIVPVTASGKSVALSIRNDSSSSGDILLDGFTVEWE